MERTVSRWVPAPGEAPAPPRHSLPSRVLVEALGVPPAEAPSYCLKMLGREEYLVAEQPLCSFSSLLEDVLLHGRAFLVLLHRADIRVEVASPEVYAAIERAVQLDRRRRRRSTGPYNRFVRNMEPASSWDIKGGGLLYHRAFVFLFQRS
jgi:hypothetical protein